jgi:predicted N-acetyltransferase YhbS
MIEIKPMDETYLHQTCLHRGAVDPSRFEPPGDPLPNGHPPGPWSDETLRDVAAAYQRHRVGHPRPAPFMKEMIRRYGTCALLAWQEQKVVGHIRFYPMKVARLLASAEPDPCPSLDCKPACEPDQDEGTLWVLCVMTCAPYANAAEAARVGARKGIGLQLARALVAWAEEHGWQRIVKVAHSDLDWFYGILGGGGKAFWQKAGFRVAKSFYNRAWQFKDEEDKAAVEAQMAASGMTERDMWTWYRMQYDL